MNSLQSLSPERFDSPTILKKVTTASRALAELKGAIASIPRQEILINTLSLQEAKDSSDIEDIVTTHDDLYREEALPSETITASSKEVHRYQQALQAGYELLKKTGIITTNHLSAVQAELLGRADGIRTLPGTTLRNSTGETVYTPPQDQSEILRLMADLEKFINDSDDFPVDPLVKMALIHHQFESIHPYYDGNGRTGRILNVLYLVKSSLLDIPILYLSRPLMKSKGEYYRQLQSVRENDTWESWVLYMLTAVEQSATDAVQTVEQIRVAFQKTKHKIRDEHKFYSHDLINLLFTHPYTKIDFLASEIGVSRLTATKYLEALCQSGVLEKRKSGRSNYYINRELWQVLASERMQNQR